MPEWVTTEQARHALPVLQKERANVARELSRLAAVPGDLDASQRSRWEDCNSRVDALNDAIEECEGFLAERNKKIDRLQVAAVTYATGDAGEGYQDARDRMRGYPGGGLQHLRHVDPGAALDQARAAGLDSREGTGHARDAALSSIDGWSERASFPDEWRESAERTAVGDPRVAEHIAVTSDPRYVDGFYDYIAGGWGNIPSDIVRYCRSVNSERAMTEGAGGTSTTAGGYMVPPFLDPAIILSNTGVANPMRSIATIKTTTTATWKGVTSAGVNAEWTAEASEMTDASPTLGQPTITPVRADCYVQASFEMIEDTSIAAELAMLFADARDRLEGGSTGFVMGNGSTQPMGVVQTLMATTASRVSATTNGVFSVADVFLVDNALSQRWRPRASWIANRSIYNAARQFALGSGAMTGAFWVDLGANRGSTMLGYGVYEASAMGGTIAAGTASSNYVLVLGDFSQYFIVDRVGLSVVYNPLVLGSNRRPTGEVGWAAFWRTSGLAVNADAFRALVT
jgi:HK97 family phage major capsid protein